MSRGGADSFLLLRDMMMRQGLYYFVLTAANNEPLRLLVHILFTLNLPYHLYTGEPGTGNTFLFLFL